MKLWKKIALSVLALPCIAVVGVYSWLQGVGDVRTELARVAGETPEAQARGRAILDASLAAMGGSSRWRELREQVVAVAFQHSWHDPMLREFFMPLEFSGQQLELLLRPGHLDARLTFLDGGWQGSSWGMADGSPYRVDAGGEVYRAAAEEIAFHVLGYRYFFFLPFHLSEAELITHGGSAELHGETYDLVYGTWGSWGPQRTVDQYLLWIHRETRLVDYVQSTVRDMFPRSIVSCALGDYRDSMGLRLPFSLKVLRDLDDLAEGMHHMEVQKVQRAESRGGMLQPMIPGG